VGDALVDHDCILEVFIFQPDRFTKALHQIGMRGLFRKQLHELIVERRVVGVPYHAEGQSLIDGMVGKIVLNSKALKSSPGELAVSELAEKPAVQQLGNPRLNDFLH
jgi:hypothetical protein